MKFLRSAGIQCKKRKYDPVINLKIVTLKLIKISLNLLGSFALNIKQILFRMYVWATHVERETERKKETYRLHYDLIILKKNPTHSIPTRV